MMKRAKFSERYGRWALVTGAASGIGAALAEALAARGLDLVIVDRDEGLLEQAARLRARGMEVRCLVGDLTSAGFVEEVASLRDELEVGLLVSNAGVSDLGPFLEIPLEDHLRALELHCRAGLVLTHRFAERMRARRRGGVILLSSNSALLHTPWVANYAATKAYTLALSEALYEELRPEGVDVMALAPGMTRTAALMRSELDVARAGALIREPGEVAEEALERLGRAPSHVSSAGDRIAAQLFTRILPKKLGLRLAARSVRYFYPRLGEGDDR